MSLPCQELKKEPGKVNLYDKRTARHVSLFGIRGTLAWVFQGPMLGKNMTRMKEKDPEQARGEAECSKHRGPEREPAGSFLGAWVPLETAGKWTDNFCFLSKQF